MRMEEEKPEKIRIRAFYQYITDSTFYLHSNSCFMRNLPLIF